MYLTLVGRLCLLGGIYLAKEIQEAMMVVGLERSMETMAYLLTA